MRAKKDFSLTTETLVGLKNSYTHEKPMVSLQIAQVIMTILLLLTMARLILDNLNIAYCVLKVTHNLLVEVPRTEAKRWRLQGNWVIPVKVGRQGGSETEIENDTNHGQSNLPT